MSEHRLWAIALACFAAVAVLGVWAAGRPPSAIDVAGQALRGQALPLAAFFTLLGRWYVLTPIALATVGIALALRADARTIAVLFASQVLAQGAVAGVKEYFHRPRPADWLVIRETDYAFPSGHAVTAIVFYLALAVLALRSDAVPRPLAMPLAVLLGACVVGVPWSRLALGAHYVTDVTGGLIFGCGWICATLAIVQRATVAR